MVFLLFGRQLARKPADVQDTSITKLFFDSFAKRVSEVENGLKLLERDLEKVKVSTDRSLISDLVLLERIQKAEGTLEESLTWIKRVADSVELAREKTAAKPSPVAFVEPESAPRVSPASPNLLQSMVMPGGEAGSLSSITTPTELQVLSLLAEEGPKSAPEIGRVIGRSREHSARLMKKLFQEGYLRRDQARIPFRYSLVERVRASFKKSEKKDAARGEAAAVPA